MSRLLLLFFVIPYLSYAQPSITGKVVDAASGEALLGTHVYLMNNWKTGTITDENGTFTLQLTERDLKDSIVVSYVGFQEKTVSLEAASLIEMQAVEVAGKTVVVTASPLIAEEFSYQKINKLEIYTNPSAQADPLLAVNSLPSATTTDESANVSFRGSSSVETGIFLNNVPVYDAVRYSQLDGIGTFSIFNTAITKSVSVFPGNPPIEFGNVTSGVISLETEDGIIKENTNSVTVSLASIGFARSQKINSSQSIRIFSNWQPSGAIKQINAEALSDIRSFTSNDVGLYWYGANEQLSWNVLSYTNCEGYQFNFDHPSYNGVFDQKKLRTFLVSTVTKPLKNGTFTFNQGLSSSKGDYAYSNVAFEVQKRDLFFGLNYSLSHSKYSLKTGVSYDRRMSIVSGNFHELDYALGENHPIREVEEDRTLDPLESFVYVKYLVNDEIAIGAGGRKNIPTDSLDYLSGQLNASYTYGSWSFVLGVGRYHKQGLFENSGTPFFSKSDQVSADIKYQASGSLFTLSIFEKASEINREAYNVRGTELFLKYRFSRKLSASGSFTYLDAKAATLESDQYEVSYFLRGNLAYEPGNAWTVQSTLVARQGALDPAVLTTTYDQELDVFQPIYAEQGLRLNGYINIGLSISKVFPISDTLNVIAFANANNVLNRANVRSYAYNRDYSSREANLFAQRTIYFGGVINF